MTKLARTKIDDLDYIVEVPDNATEEEYAFGLVVGPPVDLTYQLIEAGMSKTLARALHKELFARSLITFQDVFTRKQDVIGALQSVLKLDSERIVEVYSGNK